MEHTARRLSQGKETNWGVVTSAEENDKIPKTQTDCTATPADHKRRRNCDILGSNR